MTYRVFKPTYTEKGERRQSATYHVAFRDHLKRRQRVAGYPSEQRTHQLAAKVMRLVEHRQTGRPLAEDLIRWADTLPPDFRARLVDMDLLDARLVVADDPLLWHLDGKRDEAGAVTLPGYRQALEARGNTRQHVDTTVRRVRDTLAGCGFKTWRDLIQPGAVTVVEVWLGGRRTQGEISGKTYNYFCRELRGFCRWLEETGRAPAVAMGTLADVVNADVDSRQTRPLSIEEMRWLVETTAAAAGTRDGLTGWERAMLYRVAFETGIRPGQLRGLAVSDFALDSDPPTVTARPSTVKRRTAHTQVLKPGLAAALREAFASKLPAAPALKMPSKYHMAEMLRKDLADARAAWLRAAPTDRDRVERGRSDFLAAVNHQGQHANFYSTRHGHGTALAEAGVAEKDIAASMHHTSRTTTARYYLHSDRRAVRKAVEALPDLSYPDRRESATGTGGAEAHPADDRDKAGRTLRRPCPPTRAPVDFGGETGENAPAIATPEIGPETRNWAGSEGLGERSRRGGTADATDLKSVAR